MDDFEGFKTSVGEVIADVKDVARDLELEWSLKMWLNSAVSEQNLNEWGIASMDDQGKWLLWMGSTHVKIVEMTKKGLEFYINLADKTVAGFERID